jgi:hypothetical protein
VESCHIFYFPVLLRLDRQLQSSSVRNEEPSSRGALNSGLPSADSGLQLDLVIAPSGGPSEGPAPLQLGRRCIETSDDVTKSTWLVACFHAGCAPRQRKRRLFGEKIRPSIVRRTVRAFALDRFGFSTQLAMSSGRSILLKRTGKCRACLSNEKKAATARAQPRQTDPHKPDILTIRPTSIRVWKAITYINRTRLLHSRCRNNLHFRPR